jgi:phenylacetate-coenzyme A ligase PaaK-like adenylate-forming protein
MAPPGYHLYPDMGIFEIIDPDSGRVLPDGTGGEIVWTPLVQRGTVVLRYRTGDHIENGLTYEPCPYCGRTMPRLMGKISRVSDFRSLRFQKVKGTIIDFNELEHALDDAKGVGSWQIELRKAHDDPHDLDEIYLHVARNDGTSEEAITTALRNMMHSQFEVGPNRIVFHTPEQLRVLQKVGVALKELKIADNRPKGTAPPHETPSALSQEAGR